MFFCDVAKSFFASSVQEIHRVKRHFEHFCPSVNQNISILTISHRMGEWLLF
jgi:hypothetical protein